MGTPPLPWAACSNTVDGVGKPVLITAQLVVTQHQVRLGLSPEKEIFCSPLFLVPPVSAGLQSSEMEKKKKYKNSFLCILRPQDQFLVDSGVQEQSQERGVTTDRGRPFLTLCNRMSVCFVGLRLRAHPSVQRRIVHFSPSWRDTFLIHIAVINRSFTGSLIIHCSH